MRSKQIVRVEFYWANASLNIWCCHRMFVYFVGQNERFNVTRNFKFTSILSVICFNVKRMFSWVPLMCDRLKVKISWKFRLIFNQLMTGYTFGRYDFDIFVLSHWLFHWFFFRSATFNASNRRGSPTLYLLWSKTVNKIICNME